MSPTPKPTLKNLFYLGSGEVLTRALTFLAFAWLGRVLEPSGFGLLGSAYAVLMVGTLVVDQGFPLLGSREIAVDRTVTARFVPRVLATQITLAAAAYAVLFAATWILPLEPEFAGLLRGLGLSLLGVPFLLYWVFQGRNEMFWAAVPTVLRYWVFLVVAVLCIRGPADLHWLPVAEVAAIAAAGACWTRAYTRRVGASPVAWRGPDRALLAQTLPIGLSNLIWALRMFLPILVVLPTLGPEAAGLFEGGHRIFMVFAGFLGIYFANVYPAMSAGARAGDAGFARLLRNAALTSGGATLVLALVVTATGTLALRLIFGARYDTPEAGRAFLLLTWLVMMLAMRRVCRHALITLQQQRLELRCSVAGVVLLALSIYPMTLHFGIVGAAAAMAMTETVATALTALALWPQLRALRARTGGDGG